MHAGAPGAGSLTFAGREGTPSWHLPHASGSSALSIGCQRRARSERAWLASDRGSEKCAECTDPRDEGDPASIQAAIRRRSVSDTTPAWVLLSSACRSGASRRSVAHRPSFRQPIALTYVAAFHAPAPAAWQLPHRAAKRGCMSVWNVGAASSGVRRSLQLVPNQHEPMTNGTTSVRSKLVMMDRGEVTSSPASVKDSCACNRKATLCVPRPQWVRAIVAPSLGLSYALGF